MIGRWVDRWLIWVCAKRGLTCVRITAKQTGWHFPPLREPRVHIVWAEPETSLLERMIERRINGK